MAKAAMKARRREAPPDDDAPSALGGRFWIGVAAVLLVFGTGIPNVRTWARRTFAPKQKTHQPGEWKPGKTAEVKVTLITQDYVRLACAHPEERDGAHCTFKSLKNEPWPRDPKAPVDDNNRNVIQPYRTVPDNRLILLSDVWVHPEVAERLHLEPPEVRLPASRVPPAWKKRVEARMKKTKSQVASIGVPERRQARFSVKCKVRFSEPMVGAGTRWQPGQPFRVEKTPQGQELPVPVGRAESCQVEFSE